MGDNKVKAATFRRRKTERRLPLDEEGFQGATFWRESSNFKVS